MGAFDRRRNRARRGRCAPTGTPVTPAMVFVQCAKAVTIATSRAQFQATPTGQLGSGNLIVRAWLLRRRSHGRGVDTARRNAIVPATSSA